jgi:hypothetical protein
VVLSSAKLTFISADIKMAVSVKELNVLKQCCNPLNSCHSTSFKKNLRPVLEWMIKEVRSIQKGQRICDKGMKTIANLPEGFGNEAIVSSISEYDINIKEDLDSFKIEQTHFISSLNKTLESLEESPLSTKKLSEVKYPKEKLKKSMDHEKKNIHFKSLQW